MGVGSIYDKIKKVIYTEKSSRDLDKNKYHFEVTPDCTKSEVEDFIKETFGVEVESVNMINVKGKVKRFKGTTGTRKLRKKAIVTVKEGQTINFDKVN